ncbi:MATE family efflux transporter [Porticoccus sp. W117]|uniref:MATE family efflux transporter n=1 Tax=Porticoccus sp. W117 TaxID=3054777 RepID=UPI002595D56B|nr:MATE family efflux transporter [Porticoccus sp. W117]MDM3871542.1 MATE family efflux transporter [Porticoccus sp. W117]
MKYKQTLVGEAVRLFRFALPLVIGQAAAVGMGLTDVFMAGQASVDDLAGVTLGNSITIFVFLILGGILFANAPLIGHHFGANDHNALRNQFHQCLWLALPLGLIASATMSGGLWLVGQLGAEPQVVAIARGYMVPMIAAVFGFHLMFWLRTTLEAVSLPRAVMVVNISGLLLNILLDYALVFGHWGLPKLGGVGCGWATLIVVFFQVLAFALWLLRSRATRAMKLFAQLARPQLRAIGDILRLGAPISVGILFEFSFFGIIPLIVASLGSEVLSGHSIAHQFDGLMFIVSLGIGQALTVAISQHIGAENSEKAWLSCRAGLTLIAAIACLQVAVYLLFPEAIAAFFNKDPSVQAIAVQLLLIAAIYRFSDAIAVGAMSALRGYKITKAPMIVQFVAFWVVGFPLAYSLAMTDFWGTAMGVSGFWVGATVALSISALCLMAMVQHHGKKKTIKLI